jgi:hypothetical protein
MFRVWAFFNCKGSGKIVASVKRVLSLTVLTGGLISASYILSHLVSKDFSIPRGTAAVDG